MSEETDPSTLARKYLECLLRSGNANLDGIENMLRRRLNDFHSDLERRMSYSLDEYHTSAMKWHEHLTKVESPDSELVELASKFLHSLQFTHWVEYLHEHNGCLIAIFRVEHELKSWAAKLPAKQRELLQLEDYFEAPYEELCQRLKSHNGRDTSWRALWRLGMFHDERGNISKMKEVWSQVLDALGEPETVDILPAKLRLADAHMLQGDVLEAHHMYVEITAQQWRYRPEEVPSALLKQGRAEMLMNKIPTALETFTSAWTVNQQRLQRLLRMHHAQALHAHAKIFVDPKKWDVSSATHDIHTYTQKMRNILGGDDCHTLALLISDADIRRLHDKKFYFVPSLSHRWMERTGYPMSCLCIVDLAITTAIAYRHSEMREEAEKLLGQIEEFGMLDEKDRHVRLCQAKHLRSYLLCDGGDIDAAIGVLQDVLNQVGHEKNNRTLLWVRLDLAKMLRHRRRKGDEAAAASLFSDIVQKRADAELSDDIDLLEQAERAIQMVRDSPYDEVGKAEELLRGQGLCWVRETDLWHPMGYWYMPATDTARMGFPDLTDVSSRATEQV
ncbi:hypothetical protein VFPPC_06605 [Pochonia chlamydosporia 170]|uniref:Uncharacterized protein n=1 Tax=Pochonia chlamydosporia 170 TaxID=1380566 RepID=A0A179F4W6_METCM|nr:hypothetical protein VFPPC_06605 [Pochonia chlamydosporia 170]OAQ60466.1 hypothetical protein VFPPC_06605 [Pochonia chlamydosporia 170]